MREYYPILLVGAIIGVFTVVFVIAYLRIRKKKEAVGFDRNIPDGEIIRRLLVYAKPHAKTFAVIFVLILFSIAYDVAAPVIVGDVAELIKNQFSMQTLLRMVALYASILAVSLVCTYLQAILLQRVGQKILSKMREDIFTHIESLSHAQLSQIPVGKLVTRTANDPNAISMLFTNILVTMLKNALVVVGVLAAMLMLNYELTLMVLCFVPILVLFTVVFRKFTRMAYRKVKDGTTDINTYLSENLSGIKVTQIFNQEQRKLNEFLVKSDTLKKAKQQQIFVFGIFRPMVYMLFISSELCLLYLGAKGYIQNTVFLGQTLTSGTVVSFYMFLSKFFNPIQTLAEQFNMLQSAFASAEKIFTVLDMQPELTDEPDAIDLPEIRGEIEFKNVWFAYEDGRWVLQDVSFRVLPRQTVAFVGATGAGKTTILSLICRNYDIQKGQILIDGIDIRHIKTASLRRHFGQMLQDVFLFSGTIRSNIALRGEFTDEQIMQACRYVNADRFIGRLDGGLDEVVRERGNNFSAGQRQLLSFARTVIHRPEIMILDEATANIDTETELLIQDSLEKMKNIGTMLIVAHRLSTIQHADNIILLSHGKIMEQGTHQELLEQKGRYYQLYTLQFTKEELLASG